MVSVLFILILAFVTTLTLKSHGADTRKAVIFQEMWLTGSVFQTRKVVTRILKKKLAV